MIEWMVMAGMWLHVCMNVKVCFRSTENPIWGELRMFPVVWTTMLVWVGVWWTLNH